MTIPANPSTVSYAGDGVSTVFAVPFVFDTAADLKITDTDADGNASVLSSGFSVSGGSGATGNVTLFATLATGHTLTIVDDPQLTQDVDYIDNDPFPADSHERALDRTVRMVKRLSQSQERSLAFADGDPVTSGNLGSVQQRKNKFMYFDDNGQLAYSAAIGAQALTRSLIGNAFYPQTAAEIAAGITPVNYYYPPCHVDRYLTNTTPGTTDMTSAFNYAISAARQTGGGGNVYWGESGTYLVSSTLVLGSYTLASVNLICTTVAWYGSQVQCEITSNFNGPLFNCSGQDASHLAVAPMIFGGVLQNTSSGGSACVINAGYSGGLQVEHAWIRANNFGIAATTLCVSPTFTEVIVDCPTANGFMVACYKGDFWNGKWFGGRAFSADYAIDASGNSLSFYAVDFEFCQVIFRTQALTTLNAYGCHYETSQCLYTNATSAPIDHNNPWVDNGSAGVGISGAVNFHGGTCSFTNTHSNLVVIKTQASFNLTLCFDGIAVVATNKTIGSSFTPGTGVALPSGTKITIKDSQPLADYVQLPPLDASSGYCFINSEASGQGITRAGIFKAGANGTAYSSLLKGTATFAAAATCTVSLGVTLPSSTYQVLILGNDAAAARKYSCTAKSTTDFTITADSANSDSIDWILIQ